MTLRDWDPQGYRIWMDYVISSQEKFPAPFSSIAFIWMLLRYITRYNPSSTCFARIGHVFKRNSSSPSSSTERHQVVRALDKFLAVAQDRKHVQGFTHRMLNESEGPSRHLLMEAVISTLLLNRCFADATTVYHRMLSEGFAPSIKTESRILAVGLAAAPTPEAYKEVQTVFEKLFASDGFTEDGVLELLAFVRGLDFTPQACVAVIYMFIESRDDDYLPPPKIVNLLVAMQTRANMMDDAFATLSQYDLSNPSPYISAISGMNEVDPFDAASVDRALLLMRERDVDVNTALFNVLIRREVDRRSLYKAFSLYHSVLELSETTSISPDANTFESLFEGVRRLYDPSHRASKHRSNRLHVLSPRQLYRDMLLIHSKSVAHSRKLRMSSHLLTTALHMLLAKNDYAGAFVVLRSFAQHNLPLFPSTYSIVLKKLYFRMHYGSNFQKDKLESPWRKRFNIPSLDKVLFNDELMDHLLRLEAGLGEPQTAPRRADRRRRRYMVPTVPMMQGKVNCPSSVILDSIPLERLLRRAIIADFEEKKGTLLTGPDAVRKVSELIVDAKATMIPTSQGRGSEDP